MSSEPLAIDVQTLDTHLVVRVGGVLDGASADTFVWVVRSLPPGVDVVVDVRGLGFVDSAGLRGFARAAAHVAASGGRLRLTAPTSRLQYLLELTGLADLLSG